MERERTRKIHINKEIDRETDRQPDKQRSKKRKKPTNSHRKIIILMAGGGRDRHVGGFSIRGTTREGMQDRSSNAASSRSLEAATSKLVSP